MVQAIQQWVHRLTPETVGFALSLAGLSIAFVIVLLTRIGEWSQSLGWWSVSSLSLSLGFMLNSLQGALPLPLAIGVGNSLAVVGACLFYAGLRHMTGEPVRLIAMAPIVVIAVVGTSLFTSLWPSLPGRVVVLALCLGPVTALNISVLRQLDRGYYRFPARFLLAVNLLLMLSLALRVIMIATRAAAPSSITPTPGNVVVYIVSGLIIMGYLAGTLLLCFAEKQTLLRKLAAEDSLTGVHNRLGLRDALNAWPPGQPGVVSVFDIDHFKRVNDSFGHEVGDNLLRTFAHALRVNAPNGAIIARLGGDEFCVVEIANVGASARGWIDQLKAQLPTRLELAALAPISCRVSHGSARFVSVQGHFAQALRDADRALYRSKAERPAWAAVETSA